MGIIRKFRSKGFQRLTDLEIRFSTGLNIIKGPNEAGKSSLLRALLEGFYGDAVSRRQELLNSKSWNKDEDDEFLVEVELEDSKGLHTVTRDFQQRRNSLKLPDGKSLTDRRIVEERLGKVLGFPSRKSYLTTACIMQGEIRQVGKGASELLPLMEERLLQGTRLQEIQSRLVKENKDLERGGEKNPGPIKRLKEELTELAKRQEELYEEVKQFTGSRQELESLSNKVEEIEKEKEGINTELQKIAGYIEAKERFNKGSKKWDEADKEMKRREEVEKELGESKKELEEVKKKISLCGKKVHQAELQFDVNRLKKIEEEKGEIERQLAGMPQINEEHFRSAEGIPREIDVLKSSFRTQKEAVKQSVKRVREAQQRISKNAKLRNDLEIKLGKSIKNLECLQYCKRKEEVDKRIRTLNNVIPEMEVTINPQKGLPLRVEVDSKIIHDGEANAVLKENAKRQLEILIKDTIGIRVLQKGAEVVKLLEELQSLQKEGESINNELQKRAEYTVTPDKSLILEKEKIAFENEIKKIDQEINHNKGIVEEGKKSVHSGRKGWDGTFREIDRKKGEQEKIFSQYKVQNLQELRDLKKSYEYLQKKKTEKDSEYKALLNNRTFKQIEKELEELTDELIREGQPTLTPEGLDETKEKKNTLESKARKLERDISEKEGVLKTLKDRETLEKEKTVSAKEMAISEAVVEELGFPKNALKDSELYEKYITRKPLLEDELKSLVSKLSERSKEKHRLEGYLKAHQKGAEDIAELEENISAKQGELNRHERQLKINGLLVECFTEARDRTWEAIPKTFEQKISQYLSFITNNRYSKVEMKIKQDELNVRVYSGEKRDWIDINEKSNEPLSTGLLDQLYFATRLALIEVLAREQHSPILMDDPFVYFDPSRTEKALEILEKLSQRFQILIFTCHDYPRFEKYRLNQELMGIKVFIA